MPKHADPRSLLILAGFALSGLLALPAQAAAFEPEPPEAAAADEVDAAVEEEVLPREWRLVRAYSRRAVNFGEVPGVAILVVHNGETVYRDAHGHADLEADRRLDASDLFAVASVSKPVTATVLLLLADQTDFDLDAPVSAYLPEFEGVGLIEGGKASRAPTIAELLAHTGGLPGGTIPEVRARYRTGDIGSTLQNIANAAARLGLESEPGTTFAYGGLGYAVAARAAEAFSGKDFETLSKELLFAPLGMERTTFSPTAEELDAGVRAFARSRNGFSQRARRDWGDDRMINPGGGLFTTADDLAKFAQWHLDAAAGKEGLRPSAPEALARVRTPMPNAEGPRGRYALGWQIADHEGDTPASRVHHGGATGTLLWIDFDHNAAGVVLTQLPDNAQFLARVHALCIAAVTGERPQIERPERPQRERTERERPQRRR